MSNTQTGLLIVFDAERCCGTILPGPEPRSFVLCFDGVDDGLTHRVKVTRSIRDLREEENPLNDLLTISHDSIVWHSLMKSWLDVAAELAVYVNRLRDGSFDINDDVAARHNVRLMELRISTQAS